MSSTVLTAVATAGILGVTHAIEPDHVAGISSLTSEYGESRLSALAGVCFSLGHIVVVTLWLFVASFLLEQIDFPPVYDTAGTAGAGILLGLLGGAMAIGGIQRVYLDEHNHGKASYTHSHVYFSFMQPTEHGHDSVFFLKTGLIGALFTLSPPISMIVFSSTLLPDYGAGVVSLAVVTYGISIITTMGIVGASTGAVFGIAKQRSFRFHGGVRTVAGLGILTFAAVLLFDTLPLLLRTGG